VNASPLATQHVFGLDFVSDATVDTVALHLELDMARRERPWRCVVTPNVDHLVRYRRNPVEWEVARHAFVVLPDGMPIVWASRLVGRPLRSRLTGTDLFTTMWPTLAERSIPTVVVSPDDAVAAGLARGHHELTCIVAPMFQVDDSVVVAQLVDAIVEAVDRRSARFVFIGISATKACILASQLRTRWSEPGATGPIVLLLGAAPEFFLGHAPRAPRWMQRAGLEWLHRLAHEPVRLARRYLVDDVRFLGLVWREWRRSR